MRQPTAHSETEVNGALLLFRMYPLHIALLSVANVVSGSFFQFVLSWKKDFGTDFGTDFGIDFWKHMESIPFHHEILSSVSNPLFYQAEFL